MNSTMHLRALHRRFWKQSEQGSAAMEFAFVAPVFFALMLGIMEIGVMTFAQFALQNAVTNAGRLIRTGQAQAINPAAANQCINGNVAGNYTDSEGWFRGQICCGVSALLDCSTDKLFVNVSSSSGGFTAGTGFNAALSNVANSYSPGNACDVVLIRATYSWPVWFPGLAQLLNSSSPPNYLVNTTDQSGHLLSGTAAFRNEPFNTGIAGC